MDGFVETIKYVFTMIWEYITAIGITDVIDIALMTFVIYKVMIFVRDSKAKQLFKGVGLFIATLLVSDWFGFNTVNFILRNMLQVGIIALFILFQPELRRALERMGRTKWNSFISLDDKDKEKELEEKRTMISAVCSAAAELSRDKTGALIVFQREDNVFEYAKNGTEIDASVTPSLLLNIFFPRSPLHDGAAIIVDSRIHSAACVLPISQNAEISKELGTRHRAAIGMSESNDSLVLVVSEESGKISVSFDGNMQRDLNAEALEILLTKRLIGDSEKQDVSGIRGSIKNIKGKLQKKVNK